jgi:hypothetical protein
MKNKNVFENKNVLIGVVIAVAVILISVGIMAVTGMFNRFNPTEYVEAMLDQTLKGEVSSAVEMTDASEDVLKENYRVGIESFVEGSILNGIPADDELKAKYVDVCEKLFSDMKYEVKGVKELDGGFEVTVQYQATDIFAKYTDAIAEETKRLYEKADDGEYRGTLDEVNAQMQKEFIENSFALFEASYKNMEFGEKESMSFVIAKDESGLYKIQEGQIAEFIKKIMNLDAKQD